MGRIFLKVPQNSYKPLPIYADNIIFKMTEQLNLPDTANFNAEDALEWAWNQFGGDAIMTSSFGAEDMVIIDMIHRKAPDISISTIDTGRLPAETYELMESARDKYGINFATFFPDYSQVEKMVSREGMNLFYKSPENRKLCCNIRKVQPLKRLLNGRKAWITGLRSDQTEFRKNSNMIEFDQSRNIVKINPLINWTSDDVWNYIRENDVPYNKLHDKGYPSIGCAPCTRAIMPGENERAGRWWWETDLKECGLHVDDVSGKPATEPIINRSGGR